MADYVCVTEEGQAADQRREALADGLKKLGQEAFGEDSIAQRGEIGFVRRMA